MAANCKSPCKTISRIQPQRYCHPRPSIRRMRPQFEVGGADGVLSGSTINGGIKRAAVGQDPPLPVRPRLDPLLIYPAGPAGGIPRASCLLFAPCKSRDLMMTLVSTLVGESGYGAA
jgi:hypothetical protein